jgi:glycosyltransferase involved in cell wall biosynthesis
MNILFLGQHDIPVLRETAQFIRERRVEALAIALAEKGQNVNISGPAAAIFRFKGVELIRYFWQIKTRPNVVHIHGWKVALLARLFSGLYPHATFIWTIDGLPTNYLWLAKVILWLNGSIFSAITVPTRRLQHLTLHYLHLRTTYIPDGYSSPIIPDISLKNFDLRKGHYCLTTAQTLAEVAWVAQAYGHTGIGKKLVVVAERRPELTPLLDRYPFLYFVGRQEGRMFSSLIRQASLVIMVRPDESLQTVLRAMDASRPIIAINDPLYEETLGVTGQFIQPSDSLALEYAVIQAIKNRLEWGQKAQKRAKTHFQWKRIVAEYLALYNPALQQVPFDSAQPFSWPQQIVQS